MPTLKEEWIEKIKEIKQRRIHRDGGGYFDVMTDFYLAPDEIRYDKEMCFKVLLESNECIWNVPEEIRTMDFLEELIVKGYKGNLLYAKKVWEEEDFPFIKKYLSAYEKKDKPKFNSWITYHPKGVFLNRNMILSLVKEDMFHDEKFLLENYYKDKEMMFAMLDNHPGDIVEVPKSIKNAYFKDKNKIYEILKIDVRYYRHIPEKFQKIDEVIDYVLERQTNLLNALPEEIIRNKEKVITLINKHKGIKGEDIPYFYKEDFDIAKLLIERNGNNFSHFNFKGNEELIRLAAKTYNNISYMSATAEYEELIREIVSKSTAEENLINLSYDRGNGAKAKMIKDLFPQLLKEGKIGPNTLAKYFQNSQIREGSQYLKFTVDKELLLECMNIDPNIYKRIDSYVKEKDFALMHQYIEICKAKGLDFKDDIPNYYVTQASELKIDVDKFIMNKYLEEKIPESFKAKVKKI